MKGQINSMSTTTSDYCIHGKDTGRLGPTFPSPLEKGFFDSLDVMRLPSILLIKAARDYEVSSATLKTHSNVSL